MQIFLFLHAFSEPDRGQVYTSDSSNAVIAEPIYEALMFYDDVARVTASPALPKEEAWMDTLI